MVVRANLFGKAQIIVGDMTTHGGVVISGSPSSNWYGIPIARKKDQVYCPKCPPHIFEIAEGLDNFTDTDARLPVVTEGHLTTCGAALIAQTAPGGAEAAIALANAIQNGKVFDEKFTLKDQDTG